MPGGRPKKIIDLELMKKLASIHCTQQEISDILGICRDTFQDKLKNDEEFSYIYKKALSEGKASLRRMQWEGAKKGSNAMLIWLGKQILGQSEKIIHQEGNVDESKLIIDMSGEIAESERKNGS